MTRVDAYDNDFDAIPSPAITVAVVAAAERESGVITSSKGPLPRPPYMPASGVGVGHFGRANDLSLHGPGALVSGRGGLVKSGCSGGGTHDLEELLLPSVRIKRLSSGEEEDDSRDGDVVAALPRRVRTVFGKVGSALWRGAGGGVFLWDISGGYVHDSSRGGGRVGRGIKLPLVRHD